jgi:hypothetical protein
MIVFELIQILSGLPQGALVLCSSDEEGNNIGSVYEVGTYKAEKDGRYFDLIADEDLAGMDESELSDLIDVVVVWP